MNSLDLDGSRDIIAGLVADYEAALDGDDIEKGMECRWKLERWLWPLARWYLEHSEGIPRRILLDENDLKKIFSEDTDAETWREKLRRAMMGY